MLSISNESNATMRQKKICVHNLSIERSLLTIVLIYAKKKPKSLKKIALALCQYSEVTKRTLNLEIFKFWWPILSWSRRWKLFAHAQFANSQPKWNVFILITVCIYFMLHIYYNHRFYIEFKFMRKFIQCLHWLTPYIICAAVFIFIYTIRLALDHTYI